MILEEKHKQKIEKYLFSHFETAEQIEIEREDIIFGRKASHLGEETGASMSHTNSSRVEDAALKLIELQDDERVKWLNVINSTLNEFTDTEYEQLIDLTYNKQFRPQKVVRLMHLEKSAYYNKRNDVITQVALKAAFVGLLENKIKK